MSLILSGTDGVSDIDGTAATPAIRGTDANTGIFFPAADTIAFAEGGAEAMRITSAGAVGIGTTNPPRDLSIARGSGVEAYASFSGNGAANPFLVGMDGAGLPRLFTESQAISFWTTSTERARITSGGYFKASNDGTYEDATGAFHEFQQTANNLTLWVENSNANVSTLGILFIDIARNTTNNTFYPLAYYNRGGTAYRFIVADSGNVTNTNGSYGTISDIKHKQDIVDAGSQWNDIKNLRFRKYRLKAEVELDPNAKPFLGLVAQEAELVSPGLIEEHRDTDGEGNDLGTTTKSIKTSILYMKAVKALQEAMTRIEALEAQNAAFEARLAALENK